MYSGHLKYIGVLAVCFCTYVHGYAIHFIVDLCTLWDQLGGFNVGLPQPAYASIYMLTQVIYRKCENFIIWHWHKEVFARVFLPFHDCLLRVLDILKLSSMLDTELGYNLLRNDSRGLKSDETLNKWPHDISLARLRDQIFRTYQTVNDVSVCYYHRFRAEKIQKHEL